MSDKLTLIVCAMILATGMLHGEDASGGYPGMNMSLKKWTFAFLASSIMIDSDLR